MASKARTRATNLAARIAGLTPISDREIGVQMIRREEYEAQLDHQLAENVDGIAIAVIYAGGNNAEPNVLHAVHPDSVFQVEISIDPAKFNGETDLAFDDFEEEILANVHGWRSSDQSTIQDQRFRFQGSDFLGEVIDAETGSLKFIRWVLEFTSRMVIETTTT